MNAKNMVLFAGLVIVALAILDMMNIPLEFPTQSSSANLVIGSTIAAAPFVWGRI